MWQALDWKCNMNKTKSLEDSQLLVGTKKVNNSCNPMLYVKSQARGQ